MDAAVCASFLARCVASLPALGSVQELRTAIDAGCAAPAVALQAALEVCAEVLVYSPRGLEIARACARTPQPREALLDLAARGALAFAGPRVAWSDALAAVGCRSDLRARRRRAVSAFAALLVPLLSVEELVPWVRVVASQALSAVDGGGDEAVAADAARLVADFPTVRFAWDVDPAAAPGPARRPPLFEESAPRDAPATGPLVLCEALADAFGVAYGPGRETKICNTTSIFNYSHGCDIVFSLFQRNPPRENDPSKHQPRWRGLKFSPDGAFHRLIATRPGARTRWFMRYAEKTPTSSG